MRGKDVDDDVGDVRVVIVEKINKVIGHWLMFQASRTSYFARFTK